MSTTARVLAVPTEAPPSGPRRTLRALRVVAAAHGLALIAQPALAGVYLSGDVDALKMHGINAGILAVLGFFQLVAAILFVWKGRGRQWTIWSTLVIVLLTEIQFPLGAEGMVAVHIPLGVTIVSLQILFTVWVFRADARLPRAERKPQ